MIETERDWLEGNDARTQYEREFDTRAENVCMHDVPMRDECRDCYAIDESQHDALVQAVDSLADLDPCRDDTYHLDEE